MRKITKLLSFLSVFLFGFLLSCGRENSNESNSHQESNQISESVENNESVISKYAVTFKNYDGTILQTSEVEYDAMPEYTGEEPTKAPTAKYAYAFAGWDTAIAAVTGDATYTATYTETINKYTVTFKNYDDSVLYYETVEYGSSATYGGVVPTREKTIDYQYTFRGWNKEYNNVISEMEVYAEYDVKQLFTNLNFDLNGGTSNLDTSSKKIYSLSSDDFAFDLNKEDYTFRGWSYNDIKIFDEKGNKINNVELEENMTFKALFSQTSKLSIISILEDDGKEGIYGNVSGQGEYQYNVNIDLIASPSTGYVFVGWYDYATNLLLSNDTKYKYMMCSEDSILIAKFMLQEYKMTVYSNNIDKGKVLIKDVSTINQPECSDTIKYTNEVTISAYSTSSDTSFLGWYDENNELVSTNAVYTFVMPNKDYKLEAKWNYFEINYLLNDGVNSLLNPINCTIEDNITLIDPTKTGYTFNYWTIDGERASFPMTINRHVTFEAIFTANEYTITLDANGGVCAEKTVNATYDSSYELPIATRVGYAFDGWYSDNQEYEDGVWKTASSLTLAAKWETITYTINYELNGGTNSIFNPTNYTIEDAFVFAEPSYFTCSYDGTNYYKTSAEFLGWYKENEFINQVYEIEEGTIDNLHLYAKFLTKTIIITKEEYLKYNYIRVGQNGNNDSNGNYVLFGSYPQSRVTMQTTLTTLNSKVSSTKPTSTNSQGFTSYKYYINSSNATDYMWYKDIDMDDDGNFDYRCVYFDQYRPYYTGNSSSTSSSFQDENKYTTGNYYFFKYEPIKWRILKEENGKATILSELVLDSQDYNYTLDSTTINEKTIYSNNYEYSSIRKWLNDNFYNTAFTDLQKQIINTITVDNSASSTNNVSNECACNNTQDKVWLLSYQEAYNSNYGFSGDSDRLKQSTEYSKCQGIYVDSGNRNWSLRSPNCYSVFSVLFIDYDGSCYNGYVYYTSQGIAPALEINL